MSATGCCWPVCAGFPAGWRGSIPEVFVDDGVVLAGIGLALVDGFTTINTVVQEPIEVALVDQRTLLVAEAVAAEFARQNRGGPSSTNRSKMRRTDAASASFTNSLRSCTS